jgi:hypothetical protein
MLKRCQESDVIFDFTNLVVVDVQGAKPVPRKTTGRKIKLYKKPLQQIMDAHASWNEREKVERHAGKANLV